MIHVSEGYAQALFNASVKLGCVGAVADELPEIKTLAELGGGYLFSPLIRAHEKAAVLQGLLSGKVSPVTLEFVALLLKRGHLKYISGVAEQYRRMSDDYFRKAAVELRVPFEPEKEILDRLKRRFAIDGLTPENAEDVTINVVEDKEIIGGFIASCNGRQIDVSLKTLLAKIRRAER